MSTRKASNVRGIALVLFFVLLLVVIGFILLVFCNSNIRRFFCASKPRYSDDAKKRLQSRLEIRTNLQLNDLSSSNDREFPSRIPEGPSATGAQHLSSHQYGSSFITTTLVPKSSSTSHSFTADVHVFPSSSAEYQSETSSPESLYDDKEDRIVEVDTDFMDFFPEENDISVITEVPSSPQTTKIVPTVTMPTVSTTLLQRATVLNEPFRIFQRIPLKARISHGYRITNLLIPEVVRRPQPMTKAPYMQITTSVAPTTSGVMRPSVSITSTVPSSAKSYFGPVETTTASMAIPMAAVTNTPVWKYPGQPFTRPTPQHTSTATTTYNDFIWFERSANRYGGQRMQDSDVTETPAPVIRGKLYSENDFETENKRPYLPKADHSGPSTVSPGSVVDERQAGIWRMYPLPQAHILSTRKPQEPLFPAQQITMGISHTVDHSSLPKHPDEVERSGVNVGSRSFVSTSPPEPSRSSASYPKHKHLTNSISESRLLSQGQFHAHSDSGGQPPRSPQRYSEEVQAGRGTTSRPSSVQLSSHDASKTPSHDRDEFQEFPERQWLHQSQDPQAPPFVPIAYPHTPAVVVQSVDSPFRTDSVNSESNRVLPKSDKLSPPERDSDDKILTPPLSVRTPPTVKYSWLDENILRPDISKVDADQRLQPSDVDYSTAAAITSSHQIEIDPHEFTVPIEPDKVEHPHRHEHHYYSRDSPVVVTALMDIGRGKWPKYTRTYEQYMSYLEILLTLKNRMVIFTDHRGAEFVRRKRHNENTQIFEITMRHIPLYRYRDEMDQILAFEQRHWKYDEKMRDKPEAKSADYDVLVNSKPYFLYNATESCKFRADANYYAWIDAGYGHGDKNVIPLHCHWRPTFLDGRISVIKLTPKHDKISRYSINDLYRVDWSVVSGGFLAGDVTTIGRFYRFYHKTFIDLLDAKKVDDDQASPL